MGKPISFRSLNLIACVLLCLALGSGASPAVGQEQAKPLFSEAVYKAHWHFLSHDLLEGRSPGTRGGDLAALYIAAQFQAIGLKPISEEEGYLQQVPMQGNSTKYETLKLILSAGENSTGPAPYDELVLSSELPDPSISWEDDLLFVGYGIEAPEFDWDDYKGLDVAGKTLVMLVNDPDFEKTGFGSESLSYYGRWTYKEEIARVKGAKGLILLHTDETATYGFNVVNASWGVERVSLKGEIKNPLTVNGWIARPAIDKALEYVGLSYDALKEKADSKDFQPMPLGLRFSAGFEQNFREFDSPNVIGILPGTDMAGEAVVYMAHYDHFGVGKPVNGDAIYNGAIDNASGTAAIICLARAFAEAPEPPKRTIIFLATTAEERGLLGSEHYAIEPVLPLENTVICLNKDCCNFYGRRDGFAAGGVQYTDAVEVFNKLGEEMGLELRVGGVDRGGGAFRVDNFPFNARGVVAMSIGLGGNPLSLTEDEIREASATVGRWYHQPNDEVYSFYRYDGVLQELDILYKVGRYYADGAARPKMGDNHPFGPAIRIRGAKYVGTEK